jgi:predicted RecB family nuclease
MTPKEYGNDVKMNVRELVLMSFDKEYEQRSLPELCKAPVSAINGVSETDAIALKNAFGIATVEELAKNKHVLLSQAINVFSKYSGKILDKEFNSAEFEELRKKPVSAISGVSETDATLLKNAFSINTIQDLAESKYIQIAQIVTMNSRLFDGKDEPSQQQPSLPKPPQNLPTQPTQPQQTVQPSATQPSQPPPTQPSQMSQDTQPSQ